MVILPPIGAKVVGGRGCRSNVGLNAEKENHKKRKVIHWGGGVKMEIITFIISPDL